MTKFRNKGLQLLAAISIVALSSQALACGGEGKKQRAAHHIKRMDSNGDKFISRQEHMAFAEKRFDMADANKDGKLSAKEIKMSHLKKQKDRLDKRMQKLDQQAEP